MYDFSNVYQVPYVYLDKRLKGERDVRKRLVIIRTIQDQHNRTKRDYQLVMEELEIIQYEVIDNYFY